MREYTREEAHNLHTEMWNEIAENGYWLKGQTSFITSGKHDLQNDCFLCEIYKFVDGDCRNCPFTRQYLNGKVVGITASCTITYKSPYKQFTALTVHIGSKVTKLRRELAIEIAQLGIDYD